MTGIRNIGAFAILFGLAVFIVPIGSIQWADTFTNHRIFDVYFGWFSWGTIITWAFPGTIFFLLGVLLALFFRIWNPVPWAFLLGLVYSVNRWSHSVYHLNPSPGLIDYLYLYGDLFIPPLTACVGAWTLRSLASRYGKPVAP